MCVSEKVSKLKGQCDRRDILGLLFYIFDYCIACFVKILKFCQIYSDKTIIWEGTIVPHTLSIRGNEIFFLNLGTCFYFLFLRSTLW